jgi:hypothetical protein
MTNGTTVGKLIYGTSMSSIEMDDRTLAHLQLAIITKLRRNEQFVLTWDHGTDHGSGHSSIWISPSIPLHFEYSGNKRPTLNREWVEALLLTANSVSGLQLIAEPSTPDE